MTTRLEVEHPTPDRKVRRWKLAGLAFLLIPTAVILLFAVAEGVGQEEGWWGHLIQLAIAATLIGGAWIRPRVGGPALVVIGAAFIVLMLGEGEDLVAELSTIGLIFLPIVIGGIFFTLAGRRSRRPSPDGTDDASPTLT